MKKQDFKNWLEQYKENENILIQDNRGHITSYEEALYHNGFRNYKVIRYDRGISEKEAALFDFTGIPENRRRAYGILIAPFTRDTLEAFLKLMYNDKEWQADQAKAQQAALERIIEMGELDEEED